MVDGDRADVTTEMGLLGKLAEMLGVEADEEVVVDAVASLQDQLTQADNAAYYADEAAFRAKRAYERDLYDARRQAEQEQYEREQAEDKLRREKRKNGSRYSSYW